MALPPPVRRPAARPAAAAAPGPGSGRCTGAAAAGTSEHGLADDAIRHALAAGDADLGRPADRESYLEEQLLRRTEGATLTRLALRAAARGAPPPAPAGARAGDRRRAGGVLDEVEALLAIAERTGPDGAAPTGASIERRVSILANVAGVPSPCAAPTWPGPAATPAREVEYARAALARADEPDDLLRAMARYHLAVSDWLAGRLAEAERGDDRAARRVVDIRPMARAAAGRVRPRRRPARPGAAGRGAAHLPLARSAGGRRGVGAGGHVARRHRQVLFERDELVEAAALAATGVEQCRRLAYAPPLVTA